MSNGALSSVVGRRCSPIIGRRPLSVARSVGRSSVSDGDAISTKADALRVAALSASAGRRTSRKRHRNRHSPLEEQLSSGLQLLHLPLLLQKLSRLRAAGLPRRAFALVSGQGRPVVAGLRAAPQELRALGPSLRPTRCFIGGRLFRLCPSVSRAAVTGPSWWHDTRPNPQSVKLFDHHLPSIVSRVVIGGLGSSD